MVKSTPYIWGQVYAVLHHLLGRQTTATAINKAAFAPRDNLGIQLSRLTRVPDWAEDRFTALLADISPDDKSERLTLLQQGDFFLGYYHERAQLEESNAPVARGGRPETGTVDMVDWSAVDWALSNAEIARAAGVSRQAVAWHRQKRQ